MKQIRSVLVALFLVFAMVAVGSTSAFATDDVAQGGAHIATAEKPEKNNDQVCPPLTSGKIDVGSGVTSVTITADPGYVLTQYCVKAGSSIQGDGPQIHTIPGENVTTYTFSYPGKEISHYSYTQVPIVLVPVVTPINDQPESPTGFDYCGTEFDVPTVPNYGAAAPFTVVTTVLGNVTTVELVPVKARDFGPGIVFKWTFTYTDIPCPIFIVHPPVTPVFDDKCGSANDTWFGKETDDYYYERQGNNIVAVAKPGRIFAQDVVHLTTWPITWTDVPCEDVVEEPPVVVVTPVTPVPPIVPITPVVETPVVPVVPVIPADLAEPVTPIVPASVDIATDVQKAPVVSKTSGKQQLAHTGTDVVLFLTIVALLVAAGIGLKMIARRPLEVKK